MAAPERPYRGVSAEERRDGRRERLLEAGLELLGRDGWRATTMTAICREAGLTERYFYESFGDREQLLLAVFDRIAEDSHGAVLDAVAHSPDQSPPARIRAAIEAFVGLMTDDPRRGRIAFVEALSSEQLAHRRQEALQRFSDLVAEYALRVFRDADPDRSEVQLTAYMLVGGLAETLVAWVRGSLDVSREQLIDRCTELFIAAGRTPTRRSGPPHRGRATTRPDPS